jgi:uncharacterized protein YgbK (DUF1537 family)
MRDHPLTPMRDSNLVRVLQPQTPARVRLIRWEDVRRGPDAVAAQVADGHTLVDALTEDDLDVVAGAVLRVAAERPVVAAGGAGVATALARTSSASASASSTGPAVEGFAPASGRSRAATALPAVPVTGRLILAGSASAATRAQIAAFRGERHVLDPVELDRDPMGIAAIRDALAAHDDRLAPLLIHASPDVAAAQRALGAERAAEVLESALADLAVFAVHELGYSHLIVAGGETSGAVTSRLGIARLRIGVQAAPGVPWAVASSAITNSAVASSAVASGAGDPRTVAVLLKSGNFGAPSLFTDAWEVAP